MNTKTKRVMVIFIPRQQKLIGSFINLSIAIGRPHNHMNHLACSQFLAVEFSISSQPPPQKLDWPVKPQGFLDGSINQFRACHQLFVQLRLIREDIQQIAQQVRRGFVTRNQ